MSEDAELLDRYVENRDESAFRTLVERHINLVHSAAMRQVNGDVYLAADVAQVVFTNLARKARSLCDHPVLGAWLLTSTRYTAANLVRGEQRRRMREQEAHTMNDPDDTARIDWARVQPVIDDALAGLNAADREAVVLRFFEAKDFNAIGERLNVTDNTARMRVGRALDKLRTALERHGVTSTSGALAAALANQVVQAAPAGLAAKVAGAALAQAAIGSSAAVFFMGMTKLQIGITATIVAAGAAGLVAQSKSNAALRVEVAALEQQNQAVGLLRADNERLKGLAAEAAALRTDDAEWARLRDEAGALKAKLAADSANKAQTELANKSAPSAPGRDRLPQLKARGRPAYPAELLRAGVSGEVLVDFVVDAKGGVQVAHAIACTRPEFEAPALEALRQCTFDNGLKSGRAVNTHMRIKIGFNAVTAETTVEEPQPEPALPPKWF